MRSTHSAASAIRAAELVEVGVAVAVGVWRGGSLGEVILDVAFAVADGVIVGEAVAVCVADGFGVCVDDGCGVLVRVGAGEFVDVAVAVRVKVGVG